MNKINRIAEWVRNIKINEVKYGYLNRNFAHSFRCTVSRYNNTQGFERGIYLHSHYDIDRNIAVLICISLEDRTMEINDKDYSNEWKKKIPKNYD